MKRPKIEAARSKARKEPAAAAALDAALYSPEAVKLAAFVFESRAEISVRRAGKISYVSMPGADERLKGEFLNEVLNQQCRIDLAAKNSRIAGIIATKALLSAAGK